MPAPSRLFIIIIILALVAMAVLNIATPAGAGLSNDSAAYIAGARSILQGRGYSDIWLDSSLEAITHYPPLLSISLALLGLTGIDPLRGVRLLNILLFGLNTALLGILGWRATRSHPAAIWLASIFLLNAALLRVHIFALSEPLYLFLSLLGFLFIDIYIEKQNMRWVILSGLTASLAFLTRYSALAIFPTIALALFLLLPTWKKRFQATLFFFLSALPLMAAWFIRNNLSAGNATNRSFHYHPVTPENIQPGFFNFAQFLVPFETWQRSLIKSGGIQVVLAFIALALLAWLVLWSWRVAFGKSQAAPASITFNNSLYIFGYLAAILFSMSFFDASTKFQPRILAPIYVSLMLLAASTLAWLWNRTNRFVRWAAPTLAIVILALSVVGFQQSLALFVQGGQGYASWKWHDSQIMATLRALPPGKIIYTNTPPAVYLVTGRPSRTLPSPMDPVDNLPRSNYQQDLENMRADLLSGRAVLALFDTSSLEDALKISDSADFISGLAVLQKTQGDILYGRP